AIILIPAVLVLLQNDTGSTVVYGAFFFVLYREGLPKYYLTFGISVILISIFALKFGAIITSFLVVASIVAYHFLSKKKLRVYQSLLISLVAIGISFGVKFFYQSILQPHQQDRICR